MKTKLFLLVIYLLSSTSYTQSHDSIVENLKDKIKKAKLDSVKIRYKIELAKKTIKFNIDTSRILATEVLDLINHNSINDYYQKSKASILNIIGIIDNKEGNYENSLSNYLLALDISEKIKDSIGIGTSFNNLGMFFRRQKEYEKSKEYFKKAILIKEKKRDNESLALSHNMLGTTLFYNKQNDSALYHHLKAKELYTSKEGKAKANGNLATIYFSKKEFKKAINIFKENIKINKKTNDQNNLSVNQLNVAVLYNAIKQYEKSTLHLDSAIVVAKKMKNKELLLKQYFSKSNLNETRGRYQEALYDYKVFKKYYDSINDTKKAKSITVIEYNHKFEKEKLANRLQLDNETSRKQLYLLLLVLAIVLSSIIVWLIRKNTKQRIHISNTKLQQEQIEKLKTELTLVTKEKELKNAVIENSLRQKVLSKTLGDIKAIIRLDNKEAQKNALRSLSVSLLAEGVTSNSNIKSYLDKVSLEFKVILDTKFSKLNEREKEVLCLMTLGLNATEISKLQNSSISAIKSSRSRIRKKIGVNSKDNIIDYIKKN